MIAALFQFGAALFAQAPGGPEGPPLQPLPHPEIPAPPPLPDPTPLWLVALVAAVVTGLIAGLLWLLFRPKRPAPPPPRNAIRIARNALDALRHRAASLTPAEVGHGVSEILRIYLLDRYALPAPFRTTPELFPPTDSADPSSANPLRQRFGPVAEKYDELSFAPRPATMAEALALVDAAMQTLNEERS